VKSHTDQNANTLPSHLAYLDGFRAIAALYVVFHHARMVAGINVIPPHGVEQQISLLFAPGEYAVCLFIVLSGFCLMLPVVKNEGSIRGSVSSFLWRRARRILPPYYAAMALSLLLIWLFLPHKTGSSLWDQSFPVTTKSIVTHLLLVHDLLGETHTINPVFWSIAVEWKIYFLFPLLVWSWKRFGAPATTSFAVVTSYLLYFVCGRLFKNAFSADYIGLFTMGMLANSLAFSSHPSLERWRRLPWKPIAFLLTAVLLVLGRRGVPVLSHFSDGIAGLWAMALLICTSVDKENTLRKMLSHKVLAFVGVFSYSIYLIHAPFLQMFKQYLLPSLGEGNFLVFSILCFVAAPCIVGISYLFFIAFERPFLKKKAVARKENIVFTDAVPQEL